MDIPNVSTSPLANILDRIKAGLSIDVPLDKSPPIPRERPEESTRRNAKHFARDIDHLMENFTRGFDPSAFGAEIRTELPKLARTVLPGSYEHFLVIVLDDFDNMDRVQCELQRWLDARYPQAKAAPYVVPDKLDEGYFLAELEMLRRLLEPLRGQQKKPVFWINTRRVYSAKVCEQLEASARVIEEFKRDVLAALEKSAEDRTFYTTIPVSNPRSSMMSMKEVRIEACRATLSWDGFAPAEIELSRFYQRYKTDVIKSRPAKAREVGWLPPFTTEVPRSSSDMAREGDLVVWPAHGGDEKLFNLLLKTALWLSVARGLAAVHLFCDVARLFTARGPSQVAGEDYVSFLRYLIQVRATDRVNSNLSTPLPYTEDTKTPDNPDYFDDVWKNHRTLMTRLTERPTLFEKTGNPAPPFMLALLAPRTDILPRVRARLSRSWPRSAAKYVNRDSLVFEESTAAPRHVLPRSQSTSFFQEKRPSITRRASFLEEGRQEELKQKRERQMFMADFTAYFGAAL